MGVVRAAVRAARDVPQGVEAGRDPRRVEARGVVGRRPHGVVLSLWRTRAVKPMSMTLVPHPANRPGGARVLAGTVELLPALGEAGTPVPPADLAARCGLPA